MESTPQSVLVVDDQQMILRAVERQLRGPYNVRVTTDADEALALLDAHRVDTIVTDYRMPRADGVSLLKEVFKRYPNVHRILMSSDPPAELDDLVATGVVDRFIAKPFTRPLAAELLRVG